MKHLAFLAFLWMTALFQAQNADTLFTPKLTGELYVNEDKYVGDLFFNNHWASSKILLTSGAVVEGAKIKYQGYLDEVIWYNTTNYTPFVLDKAYINEFWTTDSLNRPVHFKRLQVSDSTSTKPKDVFVQVAFQGRYSLYIQRKVISLPDVVTITDKGAFAKKAFGQSPVYYIQPPTGPFLVLRHLGQPAFLSLFPDQKEALKVLIRRYGIRLRTEKGLMEAVERMSR
jgi:hypothetical protein